MVKPIQVEVGVVRGIIHQVAQADRVSEVLADVMQLEAYRRELAAVGQDES